jgi:hypothetical protein
VPDPDQPQLPFPNENDPDAPPPPTLGEDGVWYDPMPLEAMTPKQRARYVRMLREDATSMGPRGEIQRAREQVRDVVRRAIVDGSEGDDPTDPGLLE